MISYAGVDVASRNNPIVFCANSLGVMTWRCKARGHRNVFCDTQHQLYVESGGQIRFEYMEPEAGIMGNLLPNLIVW